MTRLPLPGGSPEATVRLHPLRTGEIRIPLAYRPPGPRPLANVRALAGERRAWVPVPAFLVEHPSAGPLLVDVGYSPSVRSDPARTQGVVGGRVMFSHRAQDPPLRRQVAAYGVDPDRVRLVVMTHLHHDHASGAGEWPAATFVADTAELTAARSRLAPMRGYHRPVLEGVRRWSAVDLRGPDTEPYAGFERTIDLFGDGSVRLLATPGHSPGHVAVLLRLRDREALLLGDAVIGRRQLRDGTMAGLILDRAGYERSLRALGRLCDERPGTLTIPSHDAELWPTLAATYE